MEYWNAFLSFCYRIVEAVDWAAVERWQTLIAGAAALFGALLVVGGLARQLRQSRQLAEHNRRKEEAAARVLLPLALNELHLYAADCIRLLHVYVANGNSPPALPPDTTAPRVPPAVSPAFLAVARSIRQPGVVDQIETLLGKLLVQHSRLETTLARHRSRALHQADGLDALREAADLHAATSVLIDDAKNVEAVARLAPPEQLANALRLSGITDEEHPIYRNLVSPHRS